MRAAAALALTIGTALAAPAARAADYGAFLDARFASQQGDEARAASDMLHALAADPSDVTLQHGAFVLALMAGRPEAVELASKQSDDPFAALLLADQHGLQNDWQGAELRYAELKRDGFTDILAPILLAWSQFAQGEAVRALATLQPMMDGQRFPAIYTLHAALIADLAHRDGEAARDYELASRAFKGNNLRLAQILASFVARNGDPARARAVIHELTRETPDLGLIEPELIRSLATPPVADAKQGIAEAYLAVAATLQQQDQPDIAALLLRLALRMRPDFAAARLLLADIEQQRRHPEAALADLAAIPKTDPTYPIVEIRQAALANIMGDRTGALDKLRAVAAAHSDRPEPLAAMGDILRDQGDFPDAIAAYDRAIARLDKPTARDWVVFFERGVALDRVHDWPRAEADLMQALKLSPDQPMVLNYLGYSWALQGRDLPRARDFIQKALDQRPNDGAIIDSLGWVKLRLGDTSGAVKMLEKAVELDPTDPTITGHLGDAYWDAGRHSEAEDQWRRALVLKPEPDDRLRIETQLKRAEAKTP